MQAPLAARLRLWRVRVFAFLFEPPATVGRLLPLLAIVSLLFGSLLWMPPIRVNNNVPPYSVVPELHPLPGGIMELAKMEHQKAIDEINLRIEHVDAWFHNKFFLVGALFAGFLLFLEPSWKEARVSNRPFEKRLNYVLRSNATCSVLALACIVALAIDMHIRDELLVIRQLGLWIEGYIEPLLLGDPITAAVKHNFLGWEQFLRVERGSAGGMHIDDLYGLLAVPHVHFLTWVLYILYIGTLHLTFSDREQNIETRAQYQIAFSFLVLLHTALFVFAISAHSAPSAFEFKVLPFTGWWGSGFVASGFWLIPWFAIVAVVSPLTCHVYSRARGLVPSDSHHDEQAGAHGGHGTG